MDQRIAVYGGSFDPPGILHRQIAAQLASQFDEVVIVPCGPRPDKPTTGDTEPVFRAAMVDMTFRGLPRVRIDLFDLERDTFTPTIALDERFAAEGAVWHALPAEFFRGGGQGRSLIQASWHRGPEVWQRCQFVVINGPTQRLDPGDLPPRHCLTEIADPVEPLNRSGADEEPIRDLIFRRLPVDGLVVPEVARYIERHGLYRGMRPSRVTRFRLERTRFFIVADETSAEAQSLAGVLGPSFEADPDLIVVLGGDGTMLRAIRQHWRRRVPFYGVNLGHAGFLLNRSRPDQFVGQELALYDLPLLWVELDDGHHKRTALAFNDVWVERATGQTAWIRVVVNGRERVSQLVADGALVATAAGSTSYARAMGGPPLPVNTPSLVMVGSNVLKPAFWKPVVLSLDTNIELATLDAQKRPIRAYLDGVPQGEIVSLRARVSNTATVELAFEPDHDPMEKLAQIQFPPSGLPGTGAPL